MLKSMDALLRSEGRFAAGTGKIPLFQLFAITFAGCFFYGGIMGTFNIRALQILFSGIKVPLLLIASAVICIPSFYVINCLLGLRGDFSASLRGVLASQATLALCLGALAPVTAVFYLSQDQYTLSIFFNGLQFAVATFVAQAALSWHYRSSGRCSRRG